MSMVNEKQSFALRCSVLYCFQCFLYKNEMGQSQLIQTLLPQGNEVPSLTTGLWKTILVRLFYKFSLRGISTYFEPEISYERNIARTVVMWRFIFLGFFVELVFCRGTVLRVDRRQHAEGTTVARTTRNKYRKAASDVNATVRHVIATGQ